MSLSDDDGTYESGRTYRSKANKMIGPLVERTPAHLTNTARQDTSLALLDELIEARHHV